MENLATLRKIAGGLLVLSSMTHVVQLYVYPGEFSAIGASIFGVIYLIIGILILAGNTTALYLGATLPLVGGILGTYRFFFLHQNPFSVFHVLIDVVVITSCIYLIRSSRMIA